ncbi:MAG: putative transcriptional regulatory protein [Frankiales bacterium]|nr:putative transcriptional regulatory protein [Frankiales bacterium]
MLSLPEVAERMGTDVVHVRTLVKDGQLLAVRDEENHLVVPERLLDGAVQVKHLVPVLTLLADAGYTPEEALRWLTTEDPTLPGTPLDALHENRATEIKRRAQALGF